MRVALLELREPTNQWKRGIKRFIQIGFETVEQRGRVRLREEVRLKSPLVYFRVYGKLCR